jgi:hypothetical protein
MAPGDRESLLILWQAAQRESGWAQPEGEVPAFASFVIELVVAFGQFVDDGLGAAEPPRREYRRRRCFAQGKQRLLRIPVFSPGAIHEQELFREDDGMFGFLPSADGEFIPAEGVAGFSQPLERPVGQPFGKGALDSQLDRPATSFTNGSVTGATPEEVTEGIGSRC